MEEGPVIIWRVIHYRAAMALCDGEQLRVELQTDRHQYPQYSIDRWCHKEQTRTIFTSCAR